MQKLIIFTFIVFLFISCKKEDHNTGVITGKWSIFSVSSTWQNKTTSTTAINRRDTMVQMIFFADKTLYYLELGYDHQISNWTSQMDTLYQCHATFTVNGNNLTINNLSPKYRPYFTVKDYIYSVQNNNSDTILNINYQVTVSNIIYNYQLELHKINF